MTTKPTPTLPHLCFLGHMVGRNPGYITTQGQIVCDLFSGAGYPVFWASASLKRYMRLYETARILIHNRRQIDIVVLEVYSGLSFFLADLASFLCSRFRLPLIMVLHGGELPNFMVKYPAWTRRVLGRADVLVAPSHFLIEKAKMHGYAVRLLPNVIDLGDYPYRLRNQVQPKLFWMRSLHDIYNPLMAIEAVAQLAKREQTSAVRLIMAGPDKGMGDAVRQRAAQLGVADRVEFPGFLNAAGKAWASQNADIYVNTNRVDNMPVSVVEAAAMGMPIVATRVGGIPYLLDDGETALLVPDGDVNAMADAVQRIVETPALAARLSQNGRQLAERSAWTAVRPQWEMLFAELQGKPTLTSKESKGLKETR